MSDTRSERDAGGENGGGGDQRLPERMRDGGSDIDRFFDALGNSRRRLILLYLNENAHADRNQLAEYIADYEGVKANDEEVERVRLDLHHRHLPKLAAHGLISYDTRTNVARLEPLPAAVEEILDLVRDLEEPANG